MTTPSAASERSPGARIQGGRQMRAAAGWLALAASPTFALMAWVAAADASPAGLCASQPGVLPVDGMTAMYLLMSLFHLSPWLNHASRHRRAGTQP